MIPEQAKNMLTPKNYTSLKEVNKYPKSDTSYNNTEDKTTNSP